MVRLYIPHMDPSPFDLDKDQAHYLKNVLRLNDHDNIHVFNETGEWLARLDHITKSQATVSLVKQTRAPTTLPPLGLAFAPLKHDAQYFLLEKATELGVRDLYPVMTQRSNIHKIPHEKWIKNTLEATQQCERLAPPTVHPLQSLDHFIKALPENMTLFVAKERGDALPIRDALQQRSSQEMCIFLIGPEGGFTPEELHFLSRSSCVKFIHLGPRILRAETAALATLTCFQSLLGDWQR